MASLTNAVEVAIQKPLELAEKVKWGRTREACWTASVGAGLMVALSPIWMYINWVTLEYFNGSISSTLKVIITTNTIDFVQTYIPRPSLRGAIGYLVWILIQALLFRYLPGKQCFGQRTPGGHLLSYTANGLVAWSVTHLLYLTACVLGLLDPAIIAKNWQGLLVATNVYGYILSLAAQLKGYLSLTYPEDRKLSGSWLFDFWAGVELNPRLGQHFDLKFFHNGRPGILAWTLINFSWAAYQHKALGYVTNSMLIVLVLQAIYVIDFFWNEDWYTRTVDMTHDHFGFMLAWGDTTFLPTFYTLQAQYLARFPTHLSRLSALAVLAVGISGYAIFRSANHQRDHVRTKDGEAILWGKPATFIRCKYRTDDGKEHNSILLTSGWWGVCRHSNYMADLILSWAMCAAFGFQHFLPWSYFFFMCVLLYHRAQRDEKRCRNKYGRKWDEYCEIVPYRLVPWIY